MSEMTIQPTNLLTDPAFLMDCARLSQSEMEGKFAGEIPRATIRDLYKEGREKALGTLEKAVTASEERSDYQVASFFGDDISARSGADNGAEIVDEVLEKSQIANSNLQLQVDALSASRKSRAKELHRQAVLSTSRLFDVLDMIRQEKLFYELDCTSFEEYVKRLKKDAEYLSIDVSTFYRKLAHKEVKQNLHEAEVDSRNLTQQVAAKINQLPPGLQAQTYQLAQELSNANPPKGKGADYHHNGKIYLERVDDAIAQVTGNVLDEVENGEPDPFDPNDTRPSTTLPYKDKDFFSPENRQKALNDAKPLPPVSQEAQETETDQEPIRLGYVRMTRYTGKEGDFLWVVGDDGHDLYEIPMRVSDVKELLK